MRPKLNSARQRGANRKGAAAVEFAVVSPVLLLFVLGIIEIGRTVMVQQILTNASREGARRACLESSTATEVETVVKNYLAGSSINGAVVETAPLDLTSAGFGDPVSVKVSVAFKDVSWLPAPRFLKGKTLKATSTMSAERPQ